MQNNAAVIRKWSDLRGLAAVSMDTGTKAGTIEDFYFDEQNDNIFALLIKTGLFGHRVLLARSINALGQDAVTFANESLLIKESNNEALAKMLSGHNLLAYRVLSESGTVVGTIGNIQIDITTPTNLQLVTFELAGGLFQHLSKNFPTFEAAQIIRYGQDVLVISDAATEILQKGKG